MKGFYLVAIVSLIALVGGIAFALSLYGFIMQYPITLAFLVRNTWSAISVALVGGALLFGLDIIMIMKEIKKLYLSEEGLLKPRVISFLKIFIGGFVGVYSLSIIMWGIVLIILKLLLGT
jgi:hypothetical protein